MEVNPFMRNRISIRVAFCGMMAALMIVVMLFGTLIPMSDYICPGLAGVFLLPMLWEFGVRSSLLLYAAVSILSLLLCPSKEAALFFVLLLGWYPIARSKLQHLRRKPVRVFCKLVLFNAATAAVYALLLFVFVSPDIQAEAAGWTYVMMAAFFLLANVTFLVYDVCLSRLGYWYVRQLRPKLFPSRRS